MQRVMQVNQLFISYLNNINMQLNRYLIELAAIINSGYNTFHSGASFDSKHLGLSC